MAATGLDTAATLGASPLREKAAPAALRLPSLRRNFSWTLTGNVIYAGCQWGMLIVLAKLGPPGRAGAEMVGQFSLGLAVSAPIMLFANLQLRALLAADASRRHGLADYMAVRVATTLLALGAIFALALATEANRATAGVIAAMGLAKAIESISDLLYGLLQGRERMGIIARSMILRGVLSLVALAAAVAVTGSVLWGTLALAAAWGVVLLLYDLPFSQRALAAGETIRPRWDFSLMSRLARHSLPLGITMLLFSLQANIPRYFIEHSLGGSSVGIFSALIYLTVVGNIVVAALGQAALPRLARYHAAADGAAFRRLVFVLAGAALALGFAGLFLAVVAGRATLTAIYRPEYAEHGLAFTCLMAGATLSYLASILGYAATASRRITWQPAALALVVLVSVAACFVLVPRYGILGASLSWALSAGVNALTYAALHAMPSDPERS